MVLPRLVGEQNSRMGGIQWSTKEVKTELLDPIAGKPIYRKAIDCGLLANAGVDTTAHGIANLNVAEGAYMNIQGYVSDGTNVENLMLAANVSVVDVDATNIEITSTADLTSSRAVVLLEYTKT